MTSCASSSINSPQLSYDHTLKTDVIALSVAIGGPILAIDTAGAEASVCLVHGGKSLVLERTSAAQSLPCESLVQSIADILADAGLAVSDLAALVASVGPGSFTGLRVGLATLQGLAIGANIPMYGASSLAVLAASAGPGWVSPVCDARRGDVFAAMYEVDAHGWSRAVVPDNVFAASAWAAHLADAAPLGTTLVGDLAASFGNATHLARVAPRRALLCIVQCAAAIQASEATPLKSLLPRYLRVSEAERQLSLA